MRALLLLLALLASCATPKSEGWQDTPTEFTADDQTQTVLVVQVFFFGFPSVVLYEVGHELSPDQSGEVGAGGKTGNQKVDQKTTVDAEATVPIR